MICRMHPRFSYLHLHNIYQLILPSLLLILLLMLFLLLLLLLLLLFRLLICLSFNNFTYQVIKYIKLTDVIIIPSDADTVIHILTVIHPYKHRTHSYTLSYSHNTSIYTILHLSIHITYLPFVYFPS